jgi:hypothetical protein
LNDTLETKRQELLLELQGTVQPKQEIHETQKKEPQKERQKCLICMDKYIQCYVECCRKEFCIPCLREWYKTSHTCPMCRHPKFKASYTLQSGLNISKACIFIQYQKLCDLAQNRNPDILIDLDNLMDTKFTIPDGPMFEYREERVRVLGLPGLDCVYFPKELVQEQIIQLTQNKKRYQYFLDRQT